MSTFSPNSMKTYLIKAIGRESGAIGITYPFTDVVEAETKDEAILALYEGKTRSGKAWDTVTRVRIQQHQPIPVTGQRKETNQ